ncbi:hypothetical protein HAZT_HAZT000332 [Hyalella azteca]|uniref:Uncharacterized protein n=1 Tax=Hyalella azteca TaxID=294128 RepID=A0A6A0HEH0_HYAAZ|nr:hypothetical protein HAZT_HAZT000332 [Hyalella azteca]
MQGLMFLFVPKWEKLLDVNVWRKALEQVIYSLSVGGGGLIVFGSYNDFNAKVHVDVLILSVLDLIASLMSSVTIFSVLGAMAYELGIADVSKVVASGPGLAFVAYPEAIARTLPVPHLWSFLFFFMVFTLGLDTLVGAFLGHYVFYLIDVFKFGIGSLMGCFFTCVTVHWVFGVNNFSDMIDFMLGFRPSVLMRVVWACIAPVTLLVGANDGSENRCSDGSAYSSAGGNVNVGAAVVVFVGSLLQWRWPLYAGTIHYPVWALVLGAAVPLVTLAPIVIVALKHVIKLVWNGRGRDILKHHHQWGPGCPEARQRLNEAVRLTREAQRLNTRVTKGSVNIAFDSTDL